MSQTKLSQLQNKRAYDNSKYYSEEPIMALATGVGGAISIIRTSGVGTHKLSQKLIRSLSLEKCDDRKLYKASLQTIKHTPIDDAVIIKFSNPKSFTGEDVLEFHVHGSQAIVSMLLGALEECGHRQALPGEFSFRAVRNGKLKLSQAEAISDLVNAPNEGAVELALEKLSGSQVQLLSVLSENLKQIAVFSEVSMDFSDQGIEEVSLDTLKKRLKIEIQKLQTLEKSFKRGTSIQSGIMVSLLGLPNVGKSSLFNLLLGEDRAIVSSQAGTTRDTLTENLTLRDEEYSATFCFHDTAGVRSTLDEIERQGVERTWKSVSSSECVLLLLNPLDVSVSELKALLEESKSAKKEKILTVFTKCDLWKKNEDELNLLSELEKNGIKNVVYTSSNSGEGVQQLVSHLLKLTKNLTIRAPGELLLTKFEHYSAVKAALVQFERAVLATEEDLFSSDVREGLLSLAPLIGETLPDDILGQIFSQFCIGK